MYNYPYAAPAEGGLTAAQVQLMLSKPALLARRLDEITNKAFIVDWLLQGTADATGSGAVLVDTDEDLYPDRQPEDIDAGGEYPLTPLNAGLPQLVAVSKRGHDSLITDEAISRSPQTIVDRGLRKIGNGLLRDADTAGLAVIASKVTQTYTGGAWSSAGKIIEDVMMAKATIDELELGYNVNTIVLKPTQYAKVSAALINGGVLPREAGNPLLASGANTFDYLGLTWAASVHTSGTDPLLVDRDQLGGVVTEKIVGGGYASAGRHGIEVKSWRPTGNDDNDQWRIRGRRVSRAVVTAPKAGIRITNTGLA